MPFDPTLPQAGTLIDADQMRSQLNGLKALIDAIVSVTGAQVQSTTTLNPGQPATATVTLVGNTLRFTFGIPRGAQGLQGPPFANAVVDNVSTLNPGEPAYVNSWLDGNEVRFDFGIPRGEDGAPGEVTQQALDDAIATTSANSDGVGFLGMVVSDPPTQSEVQQIADKVDELIAALRR